MEIRGVSGINPTDNNKPHKVVQAPSIKKSTPQSDSLKISEDVQFLEDEAFIKEVLGRIPDVDHEKINRIKAKLQNGDYNTKETIDILTERLAKVLGL
ncbi:MAG: flagellar biosynthesis anti-sigma factor FlgM [Brevinema sp.]